MSAIFGEQASLRYLVNGTDADAPEFGSAKIEWSADRWWVRDEGAAKSALTVRSGETVWVSFQGRVFKIEPKTSSRRSKHATNLGDACAPMPGQIVEVYVAPGDSVVSGQKLLVVEAMKMQQPILAPYQGIVTRVPVAKGDQVTAGQLLVHIDEVNE